jgi:hypothetical protein
LIGRGFLVHTGHSVSKGREFQFCVRGNGLLQCKLFSPTIRNKGKAVNDGLSPDRQPQPLWLELRPPVHDLNSVMHL